MLECAGDVCLYTLVVCSEWLFVVAFSTRCNCCDSYFVSFNSTPTLPAVRDLGTVDRKLQERIQQHVLAPLAKAEAEDQLFEKEVELKETNPEATKARGQGSVQLDKGSGPGA